MFLWVDDNIGILFLTTDAVEAILKEVIRLVSFITPSLTLRSLIGADN